jgi:hypothetical protein
VKTQAFDNPRTEEAKLPGYNNKAQYLKIVQENQAALSFAGATEQELATMPGNVKAAYGTWIKAESIAKNTLNQGQHLPDTVARALREPVGSASNPGVGSKSVVVTTFSKSGSGVANIVSKPAASSPKAQQSSGGAGSATIVGTVIQVAIPNLINGRLSQETTSAVASVVGVASEWVEMVGPQNALTGAVAVGTVIAPKLGLAVAAGGGAVGSAFSATTLGGIAAGGAGAIGVAAGAVAVAGVAGYAIGTGINEGLNASGITAAHEKILGRLGVYDLSYRLFFK